MNFKRGKTGDLNMFCKTYLKGRFGAFASSQVHFTPFWGKKWQKKDQNTIKIACLSELVNISEFI